MITDNTAWARAPEQATRPLMDISWDCCQLSLKRGDNSENYLQLHSAQLMFHLFVFLNTISSLLYVLGIYFFISVVTVPAVAI